jgi:16S rRNA (guanine1207-N2)-methyltransferase
VQQILDYYSPRLLTANIVNTSIWYYSKPGLPEWDSISPALLLLASHANPKPQDQVWCINCGPGAVATIIGKMVPLGSCCISEYDALAITCSELTRVENALHNMHINSEINLSPPCMGNPDLVLLNIYKGRSLNRRILLQVWQALKPGGRLLISGANDQGIQSVLKDTSQLFENISILAYKKGNRVAQLLKNDSQQRALPDWTNEPGIAHGTWHIFQLDLFGHSFSLVSLPGVFSYSGLDDGTRLLISSLEDLSGKKVLDVGCGYGIVGLYSAACGAQTVDMVDSQLLAVASSRENIARNRYPNCQVYSSDLLSAVIGKTYDYILSNPPFHAGIQVDYQAAHALITGAVSALEIGGHLQIVANRFIPYDRLMVEVFGNVTVLAQSPAYRILVSKKEKV